jgi:transposase
MGSSSGMNREHVWLFPELVEEYVAEKTPVRCIDAAVASLDLAALGVTQAVPQATGRPAYAPAARLKRSLYGDRHKIRSSRKLEQEAPRHVAVMW